MFSNHKLCSNMSWFSKSFRLITLTGFIISLQVSCYSQSSSVKIDSVSITYRNLQEFQEDLPPSINDTAYQNIKVELQVVVYLKGINKLESLELKYGSKLGDRDLANLVLKCEYYNGKYWLVNNSKKFIISNNAVTITKIVPIAFVKKTSYLTVQVRDSNNRYSTSFNKKNN